MSITIEVYPATEKPDWVKVGAICFVTGEGLGNYFRVFEVSERSVGLVSTKLIDGVWVDQHLHGREAFHKLHHVP